MGPLKRAGVDLRDEAALIRSLTLTNLPDAAVAAADALGKLPKSAAIIRELNLAALPEDELLMNYAIRSLLKHGDSGWVVGAVARLPNVRNNTQRLHLAGELAQVGRYDGWDMIETAIVAGEPSQRYTALFEVGKFRAMKDGSGNPVDLLAKLDQLRLRAPESAKTAIAQAIVRIGSEGILLPNIGSEYSFVSG